MPYGIGSVGTPLPPLPSRYAKAIAGALTAILVYAGAEFGLDLPPVVIAALETVLTGAVVALVPNRSAPKG